MTEALKPCPFCGGEPFSFEDYGHSTAWEVGCSNSQCRVEPHVWEKTKDEAIASWNTRADLVDPAAIREAALREAAGVAHKCVKAFGAKMRAAPNKQEKRDWQSMLMGAVDIEHAILALIDKKEG